MEEGLLNPFQQAIEFSIELRWHYDNMFTAGIVPDAVFEWFLLHLMILETTDNHKYEDDLQYEDSLKYEDNPK